MREAARAAAPHRRLHAHRRDRGLRRRPRPRLHLPRLRRPDLALRPRPHHPPPTRTHLASQNLSPRSRRCHRYKTAALWHCRTLTNQHRHRDRPRMDLSPSAPARSSRSNPCPAEPSAPAALLDAELVALRVLQDDGVGSGLQREHRGAQTGPAGRPPPPGRAPRGRGAPGSSPPWPPARAGTRSAGRGRPGRAARTGRRSTSSTPSARSRRRSSSSYGRHLVARRAPRPRTGERAGVRAVDDDVEESGHAGSRPRRAGVRTRAGRRGRRARSRRRGRRLRRAGRRRRRGGPR